MADKHTTIRLLRDELAAWDALLARLDATQIDTLRPGGDMTIKDMVAHLKMWDETSIARLEAAAADRTPSYPGWPPDLDPDADDDTDEINAWILETNRDRPWADVHRDWRKGYLRIVALGESFSEEALRETGKHAWMDLPTLMDVLWECYEHHRDEHRGPIEAWLREKGIGGGG